MKKLLLALSLMFTLGLSAPAVNANFTIDYQDDGSFAQVQALGGGQLAFIYFCWSVSNCYYPDIFSLHSSSSGTPITAFLPGYSSGMGYRLWYSYASGGYWWYEVYVTNNFGGSWSYAGMLPV